MRTQINGFDCLILELDDGTEIIFSPEATEKIKGDAQKALKELMRMCIHQ